MNQDSVDNVAGEGLLSTVSKFPTLLLESAREKSTMLLEALSETSEEVFDTASLDSSPLAYQSYEIYMNTKELTRIDLQELVPNINAMHSIERSIDFFDDFAMIGRRAAETQVQPDQFKLSFDVMKPAILHNSMQQKPTTE
jgi:hypothetical protein